MIAMEVQENKLGALVPASSNLRYSPIEWNDVFPGARPLMKPNLLKEI